MLSCLDEHKVKRILGRQVFTGYTTNTIKNVEELLADVRAVRQRGYTVDNEEIEIGLRCVGAPIKDHTGAVVGAISAVAPSARLSSQEISAVGYEKPVKANTQ